MKAPESTKQGMKPEVVVITGATAGVGRALALRFASEGARLLLIARGIEALEATKAEVEERGGEALIFPADVADATLVFEAADFAERNLGPIDIWINNATVSVFGKAEDISPEEYKRVAEVTYLGQVHGTLAALSKMKSRDYGRIVLVGSAQSFRGLPLQAAYSASKHALRGFFESFRAELIHDGLNIQLTMVHLPAVNTPHFGWTRSHMVRKPKPLGKVSTPEMAAAAIYEAAHGTSREKLVGFHTVRARWGNVVAPDYFDEMLSQKGFEGQLTDEAEDPDRPDNLFEPMPGKHAVQGNFKGQAASFSWYETMLKNKKPLVAAGITFFGMVLVRRLLR